MDALTEAILSVRRRMDAIERRLAKLEGEPDADRGATTNPG